MSHELDVKMVAVVKNELQLRETDDLLEIWLTNDHSEWTDEAFEAIRQLLRERSGEAPPQDDGPAATALNQRQAQDHLDQAEALDAKGQHAEALAEVEQSLRLNPRLAAAHLFRGLLLDADGHLQEAMRAYTEALRLDPQLAEAAEDLREAEREWMESGANEPDDIADGESTSDLTEESEQGPDNTDS